MRVPPWKLLIDLITMNKNILISILFSLGLSTGLYAQTVSFNFSKIAQPISGWVNVFGVPNAAVWTGPSSGITVSSVATANWLPYNGTSFDGGGVSNGT